MDRHDSDSDDGDENEELDTELEARLNAQLARSLGVDLTQPPSQPQTQEAPYEDEDDEDGEDDDQGEFAFRLFSTAGATSKVVLEDESPGTGEGGLVSSRSPSFYLAPKLSKEQTKAIGQAAVSVDDILLRSKRPLWGLAMPWKVTKISMPRGAKAPGADTAAEEDGANKRKRPGKRKRIGLRIKKKAREERVEAASKKAIDKEEHLKEKKKRLNRLKKLRKKAKNREQKAAGGESDGSSAEE